MIKEGKFGVQEGVSLLTISIIPKVFYTVPTSLSQKLGTAGWYSIVISTITIVTVFTPIYLLQKRFSSKSLMEIYDSVFGPRIGFMLSLILFISLIFVAVINLRQFTDVLLVFTFQYSPPSFIIGMFMLGTITVCFLGIEVLARFSRFFIYTILI